MRRVNNELTAGVFSGRFLNIPAARLPQPTSNAEEPATLLEGFLLLLDHQQQVKQAGQVVARYLDNGGAPDRLLAMLGKLLLREDRDFHTIQTVETAFTQYEYLRGTEAGTHVLIAAVRHLAAHAPTVRAQGQTFEIAYR